MESQYIADLVSVIIPTYNVENVISKTINSALQQTYKNIEIIVVDDASTDRTAEILYKLSQEYPGKIYIQQLKENVGAAVARNTALDVAKGQYVAFLDGDDVWRPEKLERQLALMHKKHSTLCYTAIEMVDENGRQLKGKRPVKEEIDYKFLLRNTMIATSSVVVDREKTGAFHMPLRRSGQDYATWLMLLRGNTVAHGINEALVKYTVRPNSLSSKKYKNIRKVWDIQVRNENIGVIQASFNALGYAWNAVKKYYG